MTMPQELSPHTIGHRQGPEGTYNQTMRGKFPAQLSSPSMSPAIFSPNYSYQSHSFPYKPQSPPAEEAPAAPIPSRRHLSSHPQSSSPNIKPLPQRNHSLPLKSSGVAQMPSGRGTAFRKPTDSHRPPSYDSVRAVGMAGKQTAGGGGHYQQTQSGPMGLGPFPEDATPNPSLQDQAKHHIVNLRSQPPFSSQNGGGDNPVGDRSNAQMTFSPGLPSRSPRRRTGIMSPPYQLPRLVSSPPLNSEVSSTQEPNLSDFQHERQLYEKTRLENESLVNANASMQNQVAAKDRELKSYSRRSDDLSLKLEIINRWCEWLAQSPRSQRVRPTESPSFAINEDSTRWKASFDELCRLDQQIERLRSQRRPHPTVARSNAAPKPPPSYCPPEAQPTGRPPKPANHEFGRHSITGAPKRNSTPVPSPRFNRPASAPVDNSTQPSTSAPQTEISNFTARSGALFCPDLPSPSPVPLKPRYASQKVINATYLTPPQRRNVHTDEYKRSASEYFQAQMASRQLQSVEFLLPEATKLSANDLPSDLPETAVPYSEEESTSTTSTSSSSLAPSKTTQNTVAVIDGSEDSAIADSEGLPAASQESPKKDGEEGEVGMKPILRRTADEGDEAEREGEVGSPKAGVRFHPLALLLDAALEGDLALVKKAAAEVSDVSEANDEGITALHNAVCAGRVDVVEFLVKEAGADVNAGDTDGWTPLHCAASCGNVELARILVENGAALHARTLSDHETSLDKCDQGDGDAECERYLSAEIELLGRADNGRVYALFPRGLEAAGPGSPDAYIEPDELPIWPNEELRIIDRCPAGEPDWMLAEKSGEGNKQQGLVPLAFISRFPVVRIPPASQPMPSLASSAKPNSRQYRPPSPIEEEEEASSTETEMADDSESPQMVEKEDLDTEEAAHGGGSGEPGDRSKSNGTDVGVNGQSLAGLEEGIVRTAM